MYCKYCGKDLPDGSKNCSGCGKSFAGRRLLSRGAKPVPLWLVIVLVAILLLILFVLFGTNVRMGPAL